MKFLKFSLVFSLALLFGSCTNTVKEHTETSLVPLGASVILKVNSTERAALLADSSGIDALQELPFEQLNRYPSAVWIGALVPSGADKMDWVWSTSFDGDVTGWTAIEEHIIAPWDSVYLVREGNTIAWSQNQGLLQDLLNQYNNGTDIQQNLAFRKLWTNASNSDELNVFLQHSELELVGDQFFQTDLSWARHLASWSEMDVTLRKNSLIINSVSLSSDSSNTFLSTFNHSASAASYSNAIASSASYALTMNVGKPTEWMRDFNRYRGKKQRLKKATSLLEAAGIDAMRATTLVSGGMFRAGYGEESVLGIALSDAEGMKAVLEQISSRTSVWQGMSRGTLQEKHKFIFSSLFGWFFSDLGTPSWMIHGDWLLIASEGNTLEVYAGELRLGKTWGNTERLEAFGKHIDEKAHFSLVLPLALAEEKGLISGVEKGNWSRMNVFAALDVKDDLAFGNVSLLPQEEKVQENSTYLWSTALEAEVAAGPWLVKNHRSGKNNVIVQDAQHTVYWIDDLGAISWKTTVDGPIQGELTQVDLFKNNKFQLLFATQNQLHCIDLLGRNVEDYPITLPASTSLGVAVMDYDKNRNYRFVVPCGAALYNFTSDGKLVNGWKTDAAASTIVQLPFLFQKNGKDYIITSTETQALVLNRRGETRIKTSAFEASRHPWMVVDGSIPAIVRLGSGTQLQKQGWDGSFSFEELALSEPIGYRIENYGQISWSREEISVTTDANITDIQVDNISKLDSYPGGTGVIYTEEGIIKVQHLVNNESISTFSGTHAKAGRLSDTGRPVIVIGQSNALICYQL